MWHARSQQVTTIYGGVFSFHQELIESNTWFHWRFKSNKRQEEKRAKCIKTIINNELFWTSSSSEPSTEGWSPPAARLWRNQLSTLPETSGSAKLIVTVWLIIFIIVSFCRLASSQHLEIFLWVSIRVWEWRAAVQSTAGSSHRLNQVGWFWTKTQSFLGRSELSRQT